MKTNLVTIILLAVITFASCKKPSENDDSLTTKGTSEIIVPKGFTWESSRTIKFKVNVTDARYIGAFYVVSIYDGNPNAGAHLLAKGSATVLVPFSTSVYLSKQLTEVYVVKHSPDNTKTTKIISVGAENIETSIGY
jgi:hypothetical protein